MVCLLDHSGLKMLAKVYDHTGAEALHKALSETKSGAEALHKALSETKSGAEAKRRTIKAIVIKLAAN